jgi:hypothetical protein
MAVGDGTRAGSAARVDSGAGVEVRSTDRD